MVKHFFGDNRFLHIRDDLLFLYWVIDFLVNFETDRCVF